MFKAIDDVFDDSDIEMIEEKPVVNVIIVNKTIYSRFIHLFKCVKLTVLHLLTFKTPIFYV